MTDCAQWRRGRHEGPHFAGQDLTTQLPAAPDDRDVYERPCIRRLGPLDARAGD